jgi:Holliday junction resolvase RusA-like endonuclease
MKITFTVPGSPNALKRHRTYIGKTKEGKVFRRNVDASHDDKADFLQTVRDLAPPDAFLRPVSLNCEFSFPRPNGHYSTAKAKVNVVKARYTNSLPAKRPDLDNLVKFVTDALNGVFFRDDAQIVTITARKTYSRTGYTQVVVEELAAERSD